MGTNQGLFSIPFPLQNSILPPKAQTVEGVVGQIWSLQNIDGTLLCGANDGAYVVGAGTVRRIDGLVGTWGFRKLNDHPGYLLTCDYDGLAVLKQEGGSITLHSRLSNFHEASGNFEQDSDGSIWLSHWHKGVWHFRLSDDMTRVENLEYYHNGAGLVVDDNNLVCKIDGRVYVSSVDGFHQYDERNRKLKHCDWMNNLFNTYGEALHVTQAPDGMIIAYKADYLAVAERQHNGKYQSRQVGYGNMVQQMQMGLGNIGFLENRQIVLNSNNGFFVMRPQKKDAAKTNHVMVSRIYSTNTGDTLVYMRCPELVKEEVVLPHSLNSIRIEYVMPEYRGEKGVLYSCYLEGYEKEMSTMSHSSSKEYTKLEKGKYIFHVKARNLVDGTESESQIVIRILPAWYETWWAYLLYIILIVTGVWALLRYMNLRAEKELRKVKTESVLENALDALKKVKSTDDEAVENIRSCIGKLEKRCVPFGYRAVIGRDEFYDFIGDIIREARKHDLVIVVTVSRRTPVEKLKELRTLRDNAIDSITNINESLLDSVMIETVRIKPNLLREYAIDYATTLLY